MANVIIPDSEVSIVDTKGEILQPYFHGVTDGHWYCVEVDEGLGRVAGSAQIIIPNKQGSVDEPAYSVVFNPNGPLGTVKQGSLTWVDKRTPQPDGTYKTEMIFQGKVVDIIQDLERDAVRVIAKDGRDELKDIRVIGRYIYDPTRSHISEPLRKIQFQHGWGGHHNPGGRPNMVFAPGGVPCFAPYPDFGLSENQTVPTAAQALALARQGTIVATYWTLGYTFEHYWYFYQATVPTTVIDAVEQAQAFWPEIKRCPKWIKWPQSFGKELDDIAIENFDAAIGQNFTMQGGARKGRDIATSGIALFGSIDEPGLFDLLFQAAGGWTWQMQYIPPPDLNANPDADPTEQPRNVLVTIPSRWTSSANSVRMYYATGGAAKDVLKAPAITSGKYRECSENTLTRVNGLGSLVMIETRVDSFSGSLLPAWSDAEYDACIRAAVVDGVANDQTIADAFARYPNVLCKWILNPQYDFQSGTYYANYPRAAVRRPIWPTLLSFQGSTTLVGDITPYPVRTEVNNGSWTLGPEFDGLEAWDNGVIYIPGLRDAPLREVNGAWRWTNGTKYSVTGSGANARLNITKQDVRMTLAVPCDHRMSYAVRVASDVPDGTDPNDRNKFGVIGNSPDVDKFAPGFSRSRAVDLNFLYDCWLRLNSWPEPQCIPGTSEAADKTTPIGTGALRSDLELLKSHVNRHLYDNFRLYREGPLVFDQAFVTAYRPGTQILDLFPASMSGFSYPIYAVIQRRRWLVTEKRQNGRTVFVNQTEHHIV